MVSTTGTSTTQGTIFSKVTTAYSGTGSTANIILTIDTSTLFSSTPL